MLLKHQLGKAWTGRREGPKGFGELVGVLVDKSGEYLIAQR
jgi:hypothetical protein